MRARRLERLTTIYTTPGLHRRADPPLPRRRSRARRGAPGGGRVHGAAHAALVPGAGDDRARRDRGWQDAGESPFRPDLPAVDAAAAADPPRPYPPGALRRPPGRPSGRRRVGPLRRLVQRAEPQREHHPPRLRSGRGSRRRARGGGVLPADRSRLLDLLSHPGGLAHRGRDPGLSPAAHRPGPGLGAPDHAGPGARARGSQHSRRAACGRPRRRTAADAPGPRAYRGERGHPGLRWRRRERGARRRARGGARLVSGQRLPLRPGTDQGDGGRRCRGRHLGRIQRPARGGVLRPRGDPRITGGGRVPVRRRGERRRRRRVAHLPRQQPRLPGAGGVRLRPPAGGAHLLPLPRDRRRARGRAVRAGVLRAWRSSPRRSKVHAGGSRSSGECWSASW